MKMKNIGFYFIMLSFGSAVAGYFMGNYLVLKKEYCHFVLDSAYDFLATYEAGSFAVNERDKKYIYTRTEGVLEAAVSRMSICLGRHVSLQELDNSQNDNPLDNGLSEETEIYNNDVPTIFISLIRNKCQETNLNPACLAFFDTLQGSQ